MMCDLIQTSDAKMKKLLEVAENVAASRATVLLNGESGTGKEMLARFIHSKSARSARPLVAINCAALPEGLLESELFGYEKGAFTGADQRKIGKFEVANGSTFLLDEISELPLLLQAKFLRVLQMGELERLGGLRTISVDVRVIATSNRNLKAMVQQGTFREDLFYRLNVVPLYIPPLRERPKDVEILARFFTDISSATNNIEMKNFADGVLQKLLQWNWPGNVRELQNVMERAVLLSSGQTIQLTDVQFDQENIPANNELKAGMTVAEAEKLLIMKTLDFTNHNRSHAAQMLGISIRTLRNKLAEYREEKSL